jgi:hypothetical protein
MRNRAELDAILAELVGEEHLYYQPPENVRLDYPCIIYQLADRNPAYADDLPYNINKSYQVTYISKDPDDPIPDELSKLPMSKFNRRYVSDKLYHDVYTIFY